MFKLALVALFCAQAFASPMEGDIEAHVIGGSRAKEGEYPFSVALRQITGFTFCGGALISDKYVLTTAHCAEGKKNIKVGAGSVDLSKQQVFDVDTIIIHPEYNGRKHLNDIALLKLKTPIKLGGNITTINFDLSSNEKLEGKTVTALGYGKTDPLGPASQFLIYLRRPVINSKDCGSHLDIQVTDSMFCTKGEKGIGLCAGDEGSPLMYKAADGRTYVAGLFCFGVRGGSGYPDLFTKVSSFTQWIKQNMK